MLRFFRRLALVLSVCVICSAPVLGVEMDSPDLGSDSIPDDSSFEYPVSIPDDTSFDEPAPVPEVSIEEPETPVTVDREDDEKQIVLNVTITPPSVDVKTESPVVNVEAPVVNVEAPVQSVSEPVEETEEPEEIPEEPALPAFIPYTTVSLMSAGDGEPDDSAPDTIRAVLENLLGTYTPKTQTVTQVLADGTEITHEEYVQGLPGLDWSWLASLFVFSLMLLCLFRLLGSVIRRG